MDNLQKDFLDLVNKHDDFFENLVYHQIENLIQINKLKVKMLADNHQPDKKEVKKILKFLTEHDDLLYELCSLDDFP